MVCAAALVLLLLPGQVAAPECLQDLHNIDLLATCGGARRANLGSCLVCLQQSFGLGAGCAQDAAWDANADAFCQATVSELHQARRCPAMAASHDDGVLQALRRWAITVFE